MWRLVAGCLLFAMGWAEAQVHISCINAFELRREEDKGPLGIALNDAEQLINDIATNIAVSPDAITLVECYRPELKALAWMPSDESTSDIPYKQYIIYNPSWVQDVIGEDRTQAVALFGHEFGHFAGYHFTTQKHLSREVKELQADLFAGCAVARDGGEWERLEALFSRLRRSEDDLYPNRLKSLEQARIGFERCSRAASSSSPQTANKTNPWVKLTSSWLNTCRNVEVPTNEEWCGIYSVVWSHTGQWLAISQGTDEIEIRPPSLRPTNYRLRQPATSLRSLDWSEYALAATSSNTNTVEVFAIGEGDGEPLYFENLGNPERPIVRVSTEIALPQDVNFYDRTANNLVIGTSIGPVVLDGVTATDENAERIGSSEAPTLLASPFSTAFDTGFPANRASFTVEPSPDGRSVIVAGSESIVTLHREKGKGFVELGVQYPDEFGDLGVYDAAFSPDGNELATVSANGSLFIWNVENPSETPVELNVGEFLNRVAWSFDGTWIAVADAIGFDQKPQVVLIRRSDLSERYMLPLDEISRFSRKPETPTALAFHPTRPDLVVGTRSGNVAIFRYAPTSQRRR